MNLSANPRSESLDEYEYRGFTVYVSQSTNKVFVEDGDKLIGETQLRAWNELIEGAKTEFLKGYDTEKTLTEKEQERRADRFNRKIEELQRMLERFRREELDC